MNELPGGLGTVETLAIPALLAVAGLAVAWLRHGRPVRDLLPRPRVLLFEAGVAAWCVFACAGFGVILLVPALRSMLAPEDARAGLLIQGFVFQGSLALGAALAVLTLARADIELPFLPARPRPGLASALAEGFLRLLQGWPLLLVAAVAWGGLLAVLEVLGLPVSQAPQDAARLFDEALPVGIRVGFLALAVIAAPLGEELVFRGLLLPLLAGHWRPWIAHVVTAAIFALIHGHPASFGPLLVLGLILGRAYAATGDLRVPIALHAAFNLISLIRIHLHGSGA